MTWKLKYGDDRTLDLDLDAADVCDYSEPHGAALDDPFAAVAAALREPHEFPPLTTAVVTGDQVTIALDRDVPSAGKVVAAIVHCLTELSPSPSVIRLLMDKDDRDAVVAGMSDDLAKVIDVTIHDETDKSQLCYLAASADGWPIYLNRALCEADVVLPVTTARVDGALGYLGAYGGLFPAYSDEATLARFRAPSSQDWSVLQRRRRDEVDEAAWLLGVQFAIQITPGAGDSILDVAAGEGRAVAECCQDRCRSAWRRRVAERAALVIASIEGGPQTQTWENFARALFSATHAVNDGGVVLLCTQLSCKPGPALQRLVAANDDDRAVHELRRDRSRDAISAALLAETLQRVQVFLLSDLDSTFVEDLGVGHVHSSAEIERLGRQFSSCILLGNAQHAFLEVEGETTTGLDPVVQEASITRSARR
jgi:hypothetical protein